MKANERYQRLAKTWEKDHQAYIEREARHEKQVKVRGWRYSGRTSQSWFTVSDTMTEEKTSLISET
jgi:hypothetical protein